MVGDGQLMEPVGVTGRLEYVPGPSWVTPGKEGVFFLGGVSGHHTGASGH